MRDIVYKNSVDQIIKNIENKMDAVNDELLDKLEGDIVNLLEEKGNQLFPLSEGNIDEFIHTNNSVVKNKYHFPDVVNVGELVNYSYAPSRIIKDKIFETTIPYLVPTKNTSIAFFSNEKHKKIITQTIEEIVLKLMGSVPNGLARVSLIDKTGAGQNFETLNTLHEKFLEGNILSSDDEIEEELETLKNSMSIISSSISGNGYKDVEDYNLNTDEVPQHYQFVVITNFPTGFTKKASENLLALVESGHKAGIYVFFTISLKPQYGINQNVNGLPLYEYIKNALVFEVSDRVTEYTTRKWVNENVEVYSAPFVKEKEYKKTVNNTFSIKLNRNDISFRKDIITELNKKIENTNLRPIIDIEKSIPNVLWQKKSNKGVSIPFAKRGIENIYFSIGENQYGEDENTHHAMIVGSTGSGKTVIINDIILGASLRYSPEELSFYLLDYKEGTEFAMYKNFPYVEILSMESEIEFGQEVLENVQKEISKRGKLFKKYNANNLDTYNKSVAKEDRLKRVLIIIDEFQVLFPKNPKVSGRTNELIDDILRRGRSFGFNLVLGTQTLKGVDLNPSIMSNIPLRIGLKMDSKDAVKVFGEGNTAPNFLKYPGEGIYNNSFGKSKSNISFQAFRAIDDSVPNITSLINDEIKNNYEQAFIDNLFEKRTVYNGEEKIYFDEFISNHMELNKDRFYIGYSTGLKSSDSYLKFEDNFAQNLIICGQEQDKAMSLFYSLIYQIINNSDKNRVILTNYNTKTENQLANKLKTSVDNKRLSIGNNRTATEQLNEVYDEFLKRKESMSSDNYMEYPSIYYFQYFIESSRLFAGDMFKNKEFEKIVTLISEAPEYGIHIILYASDYNTISSFGLVRDLTKFNKKIALKGGDSTKIFGIEAGAKHSKSKLISLLGTNNNIDKFKPYICFEEEN